MAGLYLFDTNAVSDAMADHPKLKARMAAAQGRFVTSVVARGEIRYGLESLPHGRRRTNLESKARLVLGVLPAETVTAGIADTYGTIRRTVELHSITMDLHLPQTC